MISVPETIWRYYDEHGRHELPWRQPGPDGRFEPYEILVSEIMLQQTQVGRVIPMYQAFLARFPDVASLAAASLGDVLAAWSGLGYNRRAKFLWQAAQIVVDQYGGHIPDTLEALVGLPGIGHNTAGAIMAYAYNKPVVFIETNIRTVYIHYFFTGQDKVTDKDILALVTQTLPPDEPRRFYWALMDYGSHLKATLGNLNKSSKNYVKQSVFEGSKRQLRGRIIRLLTGQDMDFSELMDAVQDNRLEAVLDDLLREAMIQRTAGRYHLHRASAKMT